MYDVSVKCFIFINFNTHALTRTYIYVYSTLDVPKYPVSKSGVPVPVPVPTFPSNLVRNDGQFFLHTFSYDKLGKNSKCKAPIFKSDP